MSVKAMGMFTDLQTIADCDCDCLSLSLNADDILLHILWAKAKSHTSAFMNAECMNKYGRLQTMYASIHPSMNPSMSPCPSTVRSNIPQVIITNYYILRILRSYECVFAFTDSLINSYLCHHPLIPSFLPCLKSWSSFRNSIIHRSIEFICGSGGSKIIG